LLVPPKLKQAPPDTAKTPGHTLAPLQLATRGYWSVSLDGLGGDGLASVVIDAALRVAPALAHRGTALGIMPEMMMVPKVAGKAGKAATDAAVGVAPAGEGEGEKKEGGSKLAPKGEPAVVMHVLEYGGAVQDLLRARVKSAEYAVTDAEQLQALTKTAVLRNGSGGAGGAAKGKLTLRPFLDDKNVLRLAVEAPPPPPKGVCVCSRDGTNRIFEGNFIRIIRILRIIRIWPPPAKSTTHS
jgi:hypothetical protein